MYPANLINAYTGFNGFLNAELLYSPIGFIDKTASACNAIVKTYRYGELFFTVVHCLP
jgi:hypothetical protein